MLNLAAVVFFIFNSLSSGGFAVFLSHGGGSVAVVDSDRDALFSIEAAPGERLSYPAISGFDLVYISSSEGLVKVDIRTGESVVLSSGHTGAPWFSSDGVLWYTFDGSLYRNGVSTGVAVPSFQVSVENSIVSFTDRNDEMHILSLASGGERVFQGLRYYSPTVLTGGDVIVSSLTGEIVFVPSGGEPVTVAVGEQPCWSYLYHGLFYCVSEDDGNTITGADIWFVRPGEEPVQITFTEQVLETKPSCSGELLWFVDYCTGVPDCVETDALAL